ncbi:MAG: phosphate/phosphite/phosphonate ABC transporter substrate-binding protein [Usitatibacter sp.]
MRRNFIRMLAATALAGATLAGGIQAAFAEAPKQLRFGLLPAEDPTNMVQMFKGIAEHVGKSMGLPVTVQVSESYNALIEAMRSGHLDVVYVGGSQYVKMIELGMDPVPVVLNKDTENRTYYQSCIISRSDSGIKDWADLKGKTFAFVTPTSTSGGVAPAYLLAQKGINPETDFKSTIYAGKHDAAFLAVKNKKVDAAAVGDFYFWRWKERGILQMEKFDEPNNRLINSELHVIGCIKVPNTPMVTLKSNGDKFIEDLRKAFESLPQNVAGAYKVWPSTGFVRTSHQDFVDLVGMARMNDKKK